jgi:glycosyltransferase involved in cell wall biosynthesis
MRIAIVSDAWYPQVNGVVRTLDTVRGKLVAGGHDAIVIGPDRFRTIPCPTYPEIRLAILPGRTLGRMLDAHRPEAVHIATEGPLGMAARAYCRRRGWPFTTSFHTKFPEYVEARFRLPPAWTYAWLRRFHGSAARTMVATQSVEDELAAMGFRHLVRWTRGVDTDLFHPRSETAADVLGVDLPRPIHLYTGRIAVEKNIEAFLSLDLPGSKLVVGDGPLRADLGRRYPQVHFAGARHGADLARHYALADVFVFPSLTDTFGLVLLEALASGVPVAAFPVTGPRDVLGNGLGGLPVGSLDRDLAAAARAALSVPRERCRAFAQEFSWERSAGQFFANLAPITAAAPVSVAVAPAA